MDVINVGLYGGKGIFGGRETPLEASVISCDRYMECSFYQNGQCLSVRAPLSTHCEYSKVQTVKGYTSRARKYGEFKSKWVNHEQYNKLKNPPTKLGVIRDVVVYPYPYVRVKKDEFEKWTVTDPSFGGKSIAYIGIDDFTSDLIYRICSYKPQAMMGGEIKDYQKETVPLFLAHLKEVLPQKYEKFVDAYPQYGKREVNYVGRKAKLTTTKPSLVHYKSSSYPNLNEEWEWDGEYLTYKGGYVSRFNVTKDYEVVDIRLKPSDKSVIVIESNEQVAEGTEFVD